MGADGGSDNLAFSNVREASYLGLQVEYVIDVASSGFTNDERTCHRSTSSVDSGWRGGRAFREGVLGTLPDFNLESHQELSHGKVLRVGDPDTA